MVRLDTPLISVNWLKDNLEAKNLIVFDTTIPKVVGTPLNYSKYLIPKSLFFDIKKRFSHACSDFPNTLPTAENFQLEAQKLGINKDSAIVVYDAHGIYSSARAWWLLKHFGHDNVAVLNGGLPEWISKGYKTVSDYKATTNRGNFEVKLQKSLFTDFEGVNAFSISNNALVVDARSSKRFSGELPEPRKGLRSGTIPNSVNLPYTHVLDGNLLKSEDNLLEIFNSILDKQNVLIFSCGSGITACVLALAAIIVGYHDVIVYDGSWTEYGSLTRA